MILVIITENQWKIAETIYTPFQHVRFWLVLIVSSNFLQFQLPDSDVGLQANDSHTSTAFVGNILFFIR
jgi:hypothetical protein